MRLARAAALITLRATLVASVSPVILLARGQGESQALDALWLVGALLIALSAFVVPLVALVPERLLRVSEAMIIGAVLALTMSLVLVDDLSALLGLAPPHRRIVLLGVVALFVGGPLAFWRRQERGARFVEVAVAGATIWVALTLGGVAWTELLLNRAVAASSVLPTIRNWNADSAARTLRLGTRPDVIFVVLDAYAGDSLLAAEYSVDHAWMRDTLARLGASVAPPGFHSNYSRTFASLSSTLNFSHVAGVTREPLAVVQHPGALHALIRDSRAARLFRAAGYDVHWFPAPLFAGHSLPPRGATVHRPGWGAVAARAMSSRLVATWIEQVFLPTVVLSRWVRILPIHRTHFAGLDGARRLATDGRPSFSIVHVFATHEPLTYDDDCRLVPSAVARLGERAAYAAAVRCTDRRLVDFVAALVTEATDEVAVLAVGDHAPSALRVNESATALASIPPAVLRARFDVGGFFLIPPEARPRYTVPASTINVFPTFLAAVFGTDLPPIDESMHYSRARPAMLHAFHGIAR